MGEETRKDDKILGKLFIRMLMISTFTFGGGFVIISMMKKTFSEELGWIDGDEILDITAIAQSAPGALAVNSAIVFGYRIRKLKGAIISVIATIIPPLVIISLISFFYAQFQENRLIQSFLLFAQAGVAAVIFDVVIDLVKDVFRSKDWLSIILMLAGFAASYLCGVSAITLIVLAIMIGVIQTVITERKCR